MSNPLHTAGEMYVRVIKVNKGRPTVIQIGDTYYVADPNHKLKGADKRENQREARTGSAAAGVQN